MFYIRPPTALTQIQVVRIQVKWQDHQGWNNRVLHRYHNSTQSFAALATQTASLSSSESTLFDPHNLSPTGLHASEIVFKKLDSEVLKLERGKLGLQEWEREKSPEIEGVLNAHI